MKCCILCSYCLVLFAFCTVALQETIRIDWSIVGIQGYLNSPLEVRLGDTIFFNCIPGSFTNVYYLTNVTAFRECDGTLEPFLFLVGSCINDANTNLSYPVTVNENSDVVSNFQFRSNGEFYFVSFSNGSTLTDAVSEVVRGGECLQGLKMILRVNPAPTPDISSITDPTTDSGGLSDSPNDITVIIIAVAVSLSVLLVLALVVVCVCVICSRRSKRKLMAINDCEKQNQDSKTDEVSSKKVSDSNNKREKSEGVNDKSNGITVTGDDPPLKSNNAKLPPISSGDSSATSRNKPTKSMSKSTAHTTSTPSNTAKNGSSRSTSNPHSKTTNGSSGPNPKPNNGSSTTGPKATTTRTSTGRTGSVSQPKPRRSASGVPGAGRTSQSGATSRGRKGTSELSTRNKRVGATESLPLSTGQGNPSGRGKHSNSKGHETSSLPPSSLSGPINRGSVSRKNNKPESSSGPASRGSVSRNKSRSPHIHTKGGGTVAIQNETTVGYRK